MKKIFLFLIIILLIAIISQTLTQGGIKRQKIITLVLPMEHAALDQIVKGFKEELDKQGLSQVFKVIVANAQGDIQLQRSLIQKAIRDQSSYIMPIGSAASQMTLSMVKDQKVITLAANPKILETAKMEAQVTGVVDEIPIEAHVEFIKSVESNLRKVAIIYSPAEKIYPEVIEFEKSAHRHGIQLQKLMVNNLSELYLASKAIQKDVDLIFILKDHLIVSGITTLIQQAHQLGIPLVTSDEGSLNVGGVFALGVREQSIGKEGVRIIQKLEAGQNIQELAMNVVSPLCLFINKRECALFEVDIASLERCALTKGYQVVLINHSGDKPC
ncbi:MAG: hypothetical protein K0S74_1155 [Chlamydiales bacterium]|jgi:ABC-type uncharacterized transport system substrate-binding protein|nr:hypothetical protein [Chlamydiales bacterium]